MAFKINKIHKAVNWNKEDDGFTQVFWEQNVKQFWLPEEISVSKDIKVWNSLTLGEKELYKKVLAGLTLLDTKQGNDGIPSMMSLTENFQRKAVLSFMGTMEEIHAKSYSSIFMTLLSNTEIDELFEWIESETTLQKKAGLILEQYENVTNEESLYLSMVTSVFLESFLFYSGFFYPLYLSGQGKMVASGEIISLILRDESLHGKYIGLLAQEIYNNLNENLKLQLKERVYEILNNLMDNEIEYTKNVYKESKLENEVIDFLKYNANRALENLGYEIKYDVNDINPIVLNGLSTETKTHDFFSTKGNGYQKGVYEELQDEDFIV
ncbi:MAG: class 1b ribonucleoside-diphosphate reductase subunit beta [Romboutsia sp.]